MQSLLRASARSVRLSRNARSMATASAPPSKYWVLEYKYVPDILEKRGPYRADHLAAAQEKADSGKMVLGGPVGETPEGALFIFKDVTKEEIESFVKHDVYVGAGLVPSWPSRCKYHFTSTADIRDPTCKFLQCTESGERAAALVGLFM